MNDHELLRALQNVFAPLFREVAHHNALVMEQNGLLRELIEVTRATTDTPLRALEQMMAETPEDAPTDDDWWRQPDDADASDGRTQSRGTTRVRKEDISDDDLDELTKLLSNRKKLKSKGDADDIDELPESERWRM